MSEEKKEKRLARARKEQGEEKEVESKHEAKAEAPKAETEKKPKKPRKKASRIELARGKRKTSIARASVREGSGRIRVNSFLTSTIQNKYVRELIEEPLTFAGPEGSKVDVCVSTRGGGVMGQAQAARTAIARALAQYFGEGLKKAYNESDKYFLCEDPRRVEPKKYKGRKARARFQKSYR